MKTKLTDDQKAYNRAKGSFKRRITSMLDNKGVKAVEYQLEFIKSSNSRLYKEVDKQDAIQIIEQKIQEHKDLFMVHGLQ